MLCPKCGYAMGSFETECERCKRMGAPPPKDQWARQPEIPQQAPQAALPYDPSSGMVNTSGTNDPNVPLEVQRLGWCWGGFMLSWVWGIGNQVWLAFLCLIPYVGFIMCIVLGFKGHEMAWKTRRFDSVEHFRQTMRAWNNWGIALFIISIILGLLVGIGMVMDTSTSGTSYGTSSISTQSGVTLAQYEQLQSGMSEQQVYNILGPGTELSRSDLAGYTTVMYQWEGSGSLGANMNAMFQNGELIQKAQFGLE
jgi:hypothetical protein